MSNFQIQNLQFENHNIDFIEIDGKKYISSANMANALEYSSSKSITNLFNARKTEFVEGEDYMVIDMMTVKNAPYKQIFFSMEGVIGITMLAQTPKAVAFRQWARKTLTNLQQAPQLPKMDSAYFLQISQLMAEKEALIEKQQKTIGSLEYANKLNEEKIDYAKEIIHKQDTQIEKMKTLFKQVADKTGCVKFQACARSLNVTDTELRTLLVGNKWRHKLKAMATTYGVDNGFVKMLPEEYTVKLPDGKTRKDKILTLHITEKGYNKLMQQLGKL